MYAAEVERAGKVHNIVRSMSLSPEVLRRSKELYREIVFGRECRDPRSYRA